MILGDAKELAKQAKQALRRMRYGEWAEETPLITKLIESINNNPGAKDPETKHPSDFIDPVELTGKRVELAARNNTSYFEDCRDFTDWVLEKKAEYDKNNG